MATRGHHSDGTDVAMQRGEHVLVTLHGDLGPWRERIYVVSELAPYLSAICAPGRGGT